VPKCSFTMVEGILYSKSETGARASALFFQFLFFFWCYYCYFFQGLRMAPSTASKSAKRVS
jgi:hypothetical protein